MSEFLLGIYQVDEWHLPQHEEPGQNHGFGPWNSIFTIQPQRNAISPAHTGRVRLLQHCFTKEHESSLLLLYKHPDFALPAAQKSGQNAVMSRLLVCSEMVSLNDKMLHILFPLKRTNLFSWILFRICPDTCHFLLGILELGLPFLDMVLFGRTSDCVFLNWYSWTTIHLQASVDQLVDSGWIFRYGSSFHRVFQHEHPDLIPWAFKMIVTTLLAAKDHLGDRWTLSFLMASELLNHHGTHLGQIGCGKELAIQYVSKNVISDNKAVEECVSLT